MDLDLRLGSFGQAQATNEELADLVVGKQQQRLYIPSMSLLVHFPFPHKTNYGRPASEAVSPVSREP